jgi:phenylacetate-CoA ligase
MMTLHIETTSADPGLAAAVAETVQAVCKLRGKIAVVAPGGLPNDGKVIEDARRYD